MIFLRLFILEACELIIFVFLFIVFIMEGCGILGTVGYYFMLLIMPTNHNMSRAAEARHTLRTLLVAKSYGMAAQSASQTIHPCLRMAFSPVDVSSFGC